MQGRPRESTEMSDRATLDTGSIADSQRVTVPWGPDETLELALPHVGLFSNAKVEVISPDLSNPVPDYIQTLEQSLERPIGAPKLDAFVGPGTKIAIVVDDPSRWTPVRQALPVILQRLTMAGVQPEDITISVGVGRHHAVSLAAMHDRLGDSITRCYRCYSPPVDDLSAYVDLGQTSQGIPVRIFRPVVEADVRILIGSVLPHLQAGFGGGYKLVLPGTSHRSTLGALHRQGLRGKSNTSRLLGGMAVGNPMRQAIHEAARRLGPCWSISHLMGGPSQIFQVIAGDPLQVQDLLAFEVEKRFHTARPAPANVVIVGNYPWPGDPMQSFKVILQHRAGCAPGGVLVGLFWADPREINRSFPLSALRGIAATGVFGGWSIRQLLPIARQAATTLSSPAEFMLRWACELVVDRRVLVYSPLLHKQLGSRLGPVGLFADQATLWQAAAKIISDASGHAVRVRIFPQGGLTYVPHSEGI